MERRPIKLKVMSDGLILLDDKAVTLSSLRVYLAGVDPRASVVWYYRENPNVADPPPVALDVLDAVMKARIPISLSSRADFGDVIDNHGVSHPRP